VTERPALAGITPILATPYREDGRIAIDDIERQVDHLAGLAVTAIGIGNLLGAFVEAFVLDRATKRYSGVAPSRAVFRPALVAFVAGGAGWLICKTVPGGIWVAALGGAFTIAGCVAGLLVLCRDDLLDACRLVLAAPPVQRLMLRGRAAPTPTPS